MSESGNQSNGWQAGAALLCSCGRKSHLFLEPDTTGGGFAVSVVFLGYLQVQHLVLGRG